MGQKTIVVIGLAAAGVAVINDIKEKVDKNMRIIGIDALPFAFWPIASLRAAVVPGWEDKPFATFENIFRPNSQHILLSGTTVTEITKDSVILDKAYEELGTEIKFDKLVVATGSSQGFPCRPMLGSTIDSMKAHFVRNQKQIASAESVLVIGGGAVGVEFVGEVVEQHPGKEITLVHNSDQLAGSRPSMKLSNSLLKIMKDKKVNVILSDRINVDEGITTGPLSNMSTFQTEKGRDIHADYVFVATGNRTNLHLITKLYPQEIDQETKRVKVTDHLNLESNPNIFLVGDIHDLTRYNLGQSVSAVPSSAECVAKNILLEGKDLISYTPPSMRGLVVSFGRCSGIGEVNGYHLGPFLSSLMKSRSLFVSNFHANYAAPKKWFFF